MKKYYTFVAIMTVCLGVDAQTLNQSANWPNPAWTITGNYNTAATAFESNPTTTANFAFDDDDAGNPHDDAIAAESPVINLTAAHTAGEHSIEITVDYGYRRVNLVEVLRFEYWNADTAAWVAWSNIPSNNTSVTDNFCTIPKTNFVSSALNIAAFTPTQLTGFKYRIFYDDDPAGPGWQYGFCFDAPVIQSISCEAPSNFVVSDLIDESATISWAEITGITTFEYVLNQINSDPVAAGTPISGNSFDAIDLSSETTYYFHIRTICATTQSPWRTAIFTTTTPPLPNDLCATAMDLTNETSPLSSTTVGSLNNNLTVCNALGPVASTHGDLYYSIVVPNGSTLNIAQTVNGYDSANVVFYGSCDTPIQIACFDDPDTTEVEWSNTTGSPQTVYWVQDGWSGTGTFTLAWSVIACTQPEATYTVVPDCVNGDQFLIDVNITSLGSATSLTVVDDQATPSVVVTAVGTVSFGPYPNGSPVVISIANDQDGNCFIESPALNQAACPPVNDTCATAIDLGSETSPLSSSTVGANNDNLVVCNTGGNVPSTHPDSYYSIVVPSGSTLNIAQTVNGYDSANVVFYGSCAAPTQIACFDDPDTTEVEWSNTTGSPQTVYWVQDGWSGAGTFTLEWSIIACTQPGATYTVIPDCVNGDQFLIDVNITSLGSATSLSVVDDQGTPSIVVTATGTVSFGPYPNGSPVVISISNDQDTNCFIESPALNQVACPPINDTCATAIDLGNETSPLSSTTVGANNDNLTVCNTAGPLPNVQPDTYYSIVVPNGSTLTMAQTENGYDSATVVFYGSCATPIEIACFDDPDTTEVQWANTTGSTQTVYWVQDGWSGAGTFTLEWSVIACTQPEATYAVVSDCINGSQFLIDVNITSLGSATSLSVVDNQATPTVVVTAPGTVSFGPYPNGTTVEISIDNDQDGSCFLESPDLTQMACPPANNDCTNAIALIPAQTFDLAAVEATNLGATPNAADPIPTCDNFNFATTGTDVWYSVTVPAAGTLTLETKTTTGTTMTDSGLQAYSGVCGAMVSVGCNADDGDGNFSKLVLTGLVPNEVLLVRVWGYNGSVGTFLLAAYDASLQTGSFDGQVFKAYPNPVKDVLNLSYNHISTVEVFNLVGQRVGVKVINAAEGQIDMSNLASGTYVVKITSENQVKTFKVIKQ